MGVLFSHLYFLHIDCSNLIEDGHILKHTDYVGITSLFQGHEIEFVCIDVFLLCDVSRSKKTAQLLSMILKSNSQRVGGTWELDHRVQKSILCTLCNKSWQSLCFNVTRKLIFFLYTHFISYQSSKAPQWLVWNLREAEKMLVL